MNHERYLRQMLIPGWNQARIAGARVLIVGSNALAATIAAGAAALGVNGIVLLDDAVIEEPDGFLCAAAPAGTRRVRALEAALRAINPDAAVQSVAARLASETQLLALPLLHAIIVASGRADDAAICADFARQRLIPLIVAHAKAWDGFCVAGHRVVTALPAGQSASRGPVNCVIGGLALSELRARLMPLAPGDLAPERLIRYDMAHPRRFSVEPSEMMDGERGTGDVASPRGPSPRRFPAHFVLAGAGGLGTWFGIAMATAGAAERLTIFDPDVIAGHNLNRQILYVNAIGQHKAPTLAAQLRRFDPQLRIEAIVERFDPAFIASHCASIDGVVAAVDNFTMRDALQEACGRNGVPLINGGSGALQAEVAVYSPGRSACLDCAMNLKRLAAAESRQPASCGARPEASTVIANMIAGGLMAAEALNLLADPSTVLGAVLAYDAFSSAHVGLRSTRRPCHCWQAGQPQLRKERVSVTVRGVAEEVIEGDKP